MVKKRAFGDWLKVLVLLLDEAAILVLILSVMHFWDVQIPLPITIFIALLIAVFVFIIHVKVIPSFHWKQVTGQEGMIGLQGRVVQPLTPVGTILVKGEHWKAKSIGDYIEVDENTEVVGIEGLILKVVHLRGIE
ncbi:NfeD family protein [Chloroflexota bacterium]